jgi:hypothetical protein
MQRAIRTALLSTIRNLSLYYYSMPIKNCFLQFEDPVSRELLYDVEKNEEIGNPGLQSIDTIFKRLEKVFLLCAGWCPFKIKLDIKTDGICTALVSTFRSNGLTIPFKMDSPALLYWPESIVS